VVTESTRIDHQANIGVSSFGFGGSNAHVVIKGAEASVRKDIRPVEVPFDRQRAASIDAYLHLNASEPAGSPIEPASHQTGSDIRRMIQILFTNVTGVEEIDPEIELTEQGLDSMSGTEFISLLESSLNIEIGPEILFEYPLRDQFVDEVSALADRGRN
jgi:acyl carrier protein